MERLKRTVLAIVIILAALLAGCTLPPPPQPPATPDAYPAPVGALSAYPGPDSREPVQVPDESTLIHRLYMPAFARTTAPSILGWEAASDGQALAARAAILSLPPATVRTGIPWKDVEPIRGAGYVWSTNKDAHINLLAEGGNRIIGILNWPPQWAMVSPGCSPVSPVYYADWLAYVRATVERYGDRIDMWEMINEPDAPISPEAKGWGCWGDIWAADQGGTEYGRFAAQTADTIRQTQPEAIILSGGLLLGCEAFGQTGGCGGSGITFLYFALQEMAGHIDGVAFHSYAAWTGLEPAELPFAATLFEAKIAALRKLTDLPLWMTEGGFLCHYTADQTLCASSRYEQVQAEYMHLWAETCRVRRLEACVLYSLTYNNWLWAYLLNRDGSPRLGYYALQTELRGPRGP